MNTNEYHSDTVQFDQERDEVQRLMLLAQAKPIYRTKLPEIPVLEPITRPIAIINPEAWK